MKNEIVSYMNQENFQYCDPPTIKDETIRSQVDRLLIKELSIREYHNVSIFPWTEKTESFHGEVMNSDGSVVMDVNSTTIYEKYVGKTYLMSNTEEIVPEAIYLGIVSQCWGHYFTDGIAKLWCLNNPRFRELLDRNVPIFFVAPYYDANYTTTPHAWEIIMSKVGLDNKVKPLTKPTHFRKLHIADNSLFIDGSTRYYTYEFKRTVECLIANSISQLNIPTYDKIYLSRLKLKHKSKEYGERAIQRAFEKVGYHVVYPETLSFEEQVWLYSHAKSVVATKGSICMNSVFCQPGTELIVLRKSFGTHDYQYIVSQVRDLNVTHVDSHLSVFITELPSIGPFFLYLNDNMVRFFKDKFGKSIRNNFSRWRFFLYILFTIQKKDFVERTKAPKFYYEKMNEELEKHPNILRVLYRKLRNIK